MEPDGDASEIELLVVTPDAGLADGVEQYLHRYISAEVRTASSVGDAVEIIVSTDSIECVISDGDLPSTDGVALLELVRARTATLPFILLLNEGDEQLARRAISADVTEYLTKGSHADQWGQLAQLIADVVDYYRNNGDITNSESRTKTVLEAADDMVAIVRDNRVEYVNRTGADMLGEDSSSAVTGRSIREVLSPIGGGDLTDQLVAVETDERPFDRTEARLIRDDGVAYPVQVMAMRTIWMGLPAVVLLVRTEDKIIASERNLELEQRAMDSAPIGITIADVTEPNNPLIYTNAQFERLSGYLADEIRGQNVLFFHGENTDQDRVAQIREAIDAREPVTEELRTYRKDGTEFWNRVTIAPVEHSSNNISYYVCFHEDITEEKKRLRKLQRFKGALEAAGHGIYLTDSNGTIEYVNPAFEEITGFSREEVIGKNPRTLKSGEMSDAYYEDLWTTLLEGEDWEEEIRNQRKSGEYYYAHQTIAPVLDGDEVVAFVAVQTDITDKKQREKRLQRYEWAIDEANELIAALDDEYRYLFANPAYCEFHSIDVDDVTEMTMPEVLGMDTFETLEFSITQALAGNATTNRTTRTLPGHPDRTFDIDIYPLVDELGEARGAVVNMRDIAEQSVR